MDYEFLASYCCLLLLRQIRVRREERQLKGRVLVLIGICELAHANEAMLLLLPLMVQEHVVEVINRCVSIIVMLRLRVKLRVV